jgi:bifunctional ADP-heptose synthase (sugar kinase/adenylyltransferase)
MSDQVDRDALFVIPVLVVGDVMLDRHVHGHVRRISPEAPVPVLILAGEVLTPATPAGDRSGKPRHLLAGLACVDVVVIFHKPTPEELIREL